MFLLLLQRDNTSLYETFHLLSWAWHYAVCCLQGGNHYLQRRNPLPIEGLQLRNKQKNVLFPLLLQFPNDLVDKSLLRNEAASSATYQGICVALSTKQETMPEEIKGPAHKPIT